MEKPSGRSPLKSAIIIGVLAAAVTLGAAALFIDVTPPRAKTVTAMGETFARIGIYARQNNSLPRSLADLPERPGYANRTTDAWGRQLQYEVTPEGIVRLTSLGKDGKPGGQGENADITRAYYSKRPDGSLWATSERWLVEAEVK